MFLQESFDSKDYRATLRLEFEKRCRQNPRYSLRAFASFLGLSPGRLSDILNGKNGLSRSRAEELALKLGYSKRERALFCNLVESCHSRSKIKRKMAQTRLQTLRLAQQYNILTLDTFHVISDWYHYAILELTELKSFKHDTKWIAKTLDVPESSIRLAIERLKRLDLLKEDKVKGLHASQEFTATPDGIPSEAIKNFHRQILTKALQSIDLQSVTERNLSANIMAIDRQRLHEVKTEIKNFRRKLGQIMHKPHTKDAVYCLAIQFFRLTV